MKVLLTTTSFQDSEGQHTELLIRQNWEVSYLRGPLKKSELIDVINHYDALICGDDELDQEVLERGARGGLKYISKYGVGLDKIDLNAARELGILVANCRNVNQVAVAEHVLAMLFTFLKNIHVSHQITSRGDWHRPIGVELFNKRIGIIGLGAIGKELAKRSTSLGMVTQVFDVNLDMDFVLERGLHWSEDINEVFQQCDIISLHVPLSDSTKGLVSRKILEEHTKPGLLLVNTARAGLISEGDIIWGLDSGVLGGYLTDVLAKEPMDSSCLLKGKRDVMITPHIGSRTHETIQRQGSMAVQNLVNLISGG